MKFIKKITAILIITSLLLLSCDKKEKEYNLTLNDGTEVFYNSNDESAISVISWSEFNTINKSLLNLKDKDYNITIKSLEDLNGSITNLANTVPSSLKTEEVLEEGVDHQFFYTFFNGLASTEYTDTDENGDPIGLTFTLTTLAAGSESLTVSLKHEPNKSGAGVVDGSITNADGETDVEVTFALTVE